MTDMQKLGIYTEEFPQTVDRLTACGQCLYNLIIHRNLYLYPDKDVERHILNAVAKTTPRGFRIVKDIKSKRIDICIALAIAAYGETQIFVPPPRKKKIYHNEALGGFWVEDDEPEPPFNWPHIVPVEE